MSLPPSFRNLAGANLAAQSAEQISLAAVPIVAVLMLGAGPTEIGLLATAQSLPFLLLSIPLGLLADRRSRRALMLWAEGVRALALLGLFAAVAAGVVSLPLLAVLGTLGAAGTVAFSVAAPALVPSLVAREHLATANGRLELARSAAYAGGPALAGALVAWAGAPAAFVVATLLSCGAIVALRGLVEPSRSPAPARHVWVELREGAAFVWQNPLLRPILLTAVVWNLSWFVLQAAYVPHAVRALGLSAQGVGLTLACYGGGMVLGALLASRLLANIEFGAAVLLGPAISVAAGLVMLATLWMPSGALAGLSFFLFGLGPIVWTITSTTLRQTLTPGSMLGRVTSMFLAVNTGARPLGAALGALLGSVGGEAACLVAAALGFGVQALIIAASPVRGLQELPAG